MKIAILGDWRERNAQSWGMRGTQSEFIKACHDLGARISKMGHSIIVASESPETADPYVVDGIIEYAKKSDLRNPIVNIHCPMFDSPYEDLARAYPYLFVYYPKSQPNWQTTHLITIRESDVVIIIGGDSTAYNAGMAAILSNAKLIPIGSFGGAAERLLNTLEEKKANNIDSFRYLHSPWSDFVLERILDLIRKEEVQGKPKLRELIDRYFSDGELRDLCFDLQIDYDNLPGETKSAKCRELIARFQRHGGITDLIRELKQQRKDVPWDEAIV